MTGIPDLQAGKVQLVVPRPVGESQAEGPDPVAQHVENDISIEKRVVLRFRLEREDPRPPGHRGPDRVHADVCAHVNQNLADHRQMVAELESLGFRYDPAQVAAAERKDGPFKGVAEYVFKR